jgi:hypothetical protein
MCANEHFVFATSIGAPAPRGASRPSRTRVPSHEDAAPGGGFPGPAHGAGAGIDDARIVVPGGQSGRIFARPPDH